MNTVLITNYAFDALNKRVTFSDFTLIDLRRVVSVTNITRGQQIYFWKSTTFNGSAAGNVLSLNYTINADSFTNADQLAIEYLADNIPYEVIASGIRTTSGQGADLTCYSKGMMFIFDVTAASGTTPVFKPKIQMKDFHGNYIDVIGAVTVDITVAGQKTVIIYPDITPVANVNISSVMPRIYRVAWTITGTTPSFTFRVSGQPIN